jgi:hypothetical protein
MACADRLAEAFIFPVTGPTACGRIWRCRCRDCDKTWDFHNRGRLPPPEIILKRARRDGWLVGQGRKPRCPLHAVEPAKYRSIVFDPGPPAPVIQPLKGQTMSASATASVSQNQPNPKLVRQVMGLLEDHFDEKVRRYRAGWSDERVTKETGVHIGQVAKIRCEYFADLAEDPELAKLRDALAELELRAEALHKDAKSLAAKLESLIAARKI